MKPYFFYLTAPSVSGVSLVFATTARKAKALGWREWPGRGGWWDGPLYTEARVHRAPEAFRAFAQQDGPHVIDSYDSDAETWEAALEELTRNQQRRGLLRERE